MERHAIRAPSCFVVTEEEHARKAQGAGTPSPTDLIGVAGAGDLPNVVKNIPAFFKMIPTSFKAFQAYKKSLEKADIKPDVSDSDLAVPEI